MDDLGGCLMGLILAIALGFAIAVPIKIDSGYDACKTYVYCGDIKSAQAACYGVGWKPEGDK